MLGLCLVLVINLFVVTRGDPQEFRSAPTTVKAQENNTVLLPCYLETTNNGESLKRNEKQHLFNVRFTNAFLLVFVASLLQFL